MKTNKNILKKGMAFVLLCSSVFCALPENTFASTVKANMKVYVDGKAIAFNNQTGAPVVDDGRTYLPVRIISESMGIDIKYDQPTKAVQIRMEGVSLDLFDNNYLAVKNGVWIPIDERNGVPQKTTTVKILEGRTYAPIRFISEQLGVNVVYSQGNVFLTTKSLDGLDLNKDLSAKDVLGIREDDPSIGQLTLSTLKTYLDPSKKNDLDMLKIRKIDKDSLPISIGQGVNLIGVEIRKDEIILELDKKIPGISLLLMNNKRISTLTNIYPATGLLANKDKNEYVLYLKNLYANEPDAAPGGKNEVNYIGICLSSGLLNNTGIVSNSTIYLMSLN